MRRRPAADVPAFAQRLAPVLAQVYANRGLCAESELNLKLDQLLPPGDLLGLADAAVLLADCVEQQKTIVIVGDFDADGATSSALAVTVLQQVGAGNVSYLVPNRFEYGYGLTPEIVALALQRQPDLIITVDNGISSLEGVAAAAEQGVKTLITDHHLPGASLPDAEVIVNPNQPGCTFASKNLAGVGVIFYVMLALRAELRGRGWFERQSGAEPNLAEVLDLVALGTVADVVPLDKNNRILVEQGLLRMRAGNARPGIRALLEIANRPLARLTASDLSYAVAPRLNAAGRLDDMSVGIECLLAADEATGRQYATQLNDLNRDRQLIEREMQREAMLLLEEFLRTTGGSVPPALCLYDSNWHQGVVGILASRIKEHLHRPTIAFAEGEPGEIKGSARSIPGLHIRDALDRVATQYPGLVKKFGGHAMAAGLSLADTDFERFRDAFESEVERLLDGVELDAVVETDGELAAHDLTLPLARILRYAGPWGQHFPEPLFDGVFQVVHQRLVGERHLKLVLSHPDRPDNLLDAIAFNIDRDLWPNHAVQRIAIAYHLDSNEYRGRESLQLLVEVIDTC
ncbi:MAG: single-stranded-DNA-specific exonuclease RecJ [Gammaproteobacteria bacterium]|nr:single-stranded-DNA-specific exonuclease RecJ [Gammaproteobacteria bacterium]